MGIRGLTLGAGDLKVSSSEFCQESIAVLQEKIWLSVAAIRPFFGRAADQFLNFFFQMGWSITCNGSLSVINTSNEPPWHALSENGRQPQFWPQFGVDMGGFYANFREFSPFLVLPVYKNLLLHPALGSDPNPNPERLEKDISLAFWMQPRPHGHGVGLLHGYNPDTFRTRTKVGQLYEPINLRYFLNQSNLDPMDMG